MRDSLLDGGRGVRTGPDHLRRDYRTARVIYRSQIIRHAFGRSAARAFLKAARVAPALAERVLNGAPHLLRR